MSFDDKIKYNILYDYYEKLLTDKQKEYFEKSFFDDLSLQEISEIYNVSRNAVYDQIKKTLKLLDFYEEKLMLHKKQLKREELYKKLNITDEELLNIK